MRKPSNDDFNLAVLIEIAQKDDAFIREMIALFLKTARETIDLINLHYKNGDFSQCSDKAHKLKSSIQIIGDEELNQLVKKIENSSRLENPKPELKHLIPPLNTKMAELIYFLENRLKDPSKFS